MFFNSQFSIYMTLDEYILQHIDEEGDYLKALYRDTHLSRILQYNYLFDEEHRKDAHYQLKEKMIWGKKET